jgi:hypothetical protein
VDWSYRLLMEPERALLRRLSVFAGGFTLEAAESVGAGEGIEAHHVLDLLSQLVDKSLVVLDEDVADGRLHLLETVRQYAASRLADAEEAEDVRRRHFEFFLRVATLEPGESDDANRTRVTTEYENMRRALRWAADHEDPLPILRLTAELFMFWAWGTRLRDGRRWTEIAIARAPVDDPVRHARALRSYAYLRGLTGEPSAALLGHVLESLELSRSLGDTHGIVDALTMAGNMEMSTGLPQAWEHLEEAIRLAREAGYDRGLAFALLAAGLERFSREVGRQGDSRVLLDEARVKLHEAIELARRVGVGYVERMATAMLGQFCAVGGDPRGAIRYCEQAVAMLRAAGDGYYLMTALGVLVQVLGQLASSTGPAACPTRCRSSRPRWGTKGASEWPLICGLRSQYGPANGRRHGAWRRAWGNKRSVCCSRRPLWTAMSMRQPRMLTALPPERTHRRRSPSCTY